MDEVAQQIRVVGVDKERIRQHGNLREVWIVPFKLSERPDESWGRNYREVLKKSTNPKKKEAYVVGDTLEVNIGEGDALQDILELIKKDIADTNALCLEVYQRKIKMQQDLKALQQLQKNTLQRMKEDADKLNL